MLLLHIVKLRLKKLKNRSFCELKKALINLENLVKIEKNDANDANPR